MLIYQIYLQTYALLMMNCHKELLHPYILQI